MNDTDDQYETFMVLHATEMREKAIAAVGTPCPSCSEPLSVRSVLPWLECKNKHNIRPWTEVEIEAMEKHNAL